MLYYTEYTTPLGEAFGSLMLICEDDKLIGVYTEEQKHVLESFKVKLVKNNENTVFKQVTAWLDSYFAGNRNLKISDLPLAPKGNEFRQLVWQELCRIPYGQTTTYGETAKKVAAKMGKETMSAQAVGGAIGHNPIGIIIPCHRVIGKDGKMVGYAGGLFRKIMLLNHEKAI